MKNVNASSNVQLTVIILVLDLFSVSAIKMISVRDVRLKWLPKTDKETYVNGCKRRTKTEQEVQHVYSYIGIKGVPTNIMISAISFTFNATKKLIKLHQMIESYQKRTKADLE